MMLLTIPLPGSKLRVKAAVLAGLAIAGLSGASHSAVGYAVTVNGTQVGSARDKQTIVQAISDTEELLKNDLGYDYTIDTEIKPTLTPGSMTGTELELGIIGMLPDVNLMWTINVDGQTVGALSTRKDAEALTQEILSRYTNDRTVSASFLQNVTYELKYVGSDTETDEAAIAEMLDPENTDSPYRLQVFTVETETKSHKVLHETEYVYSYDYYEDESFVSVEGVDGKETVTSEVRCVNGNEIYRQVLTTVTNKVTVNEEITVGLVEYPTTDSTGWFIWPAEGEISSYFGYRDIDYGSSYHRGIDIAGDYYSNILAADGGVVTYADWMSGYGYLVIIQHDNGWETYYGHNTELNVYEGERVAQGDVIAFMGSTGNSSGDHCHFEVRIDGEAYNPLNYLP